MTMHRVRGAVLGILTGAAIGLGFTVTIALVVAIPHAETSP